MMNIKSNVFLHPMCHSHYYYFLMDVENQDEQETVGVNFVPLFLLKAIELVMFAITASTLKYPGRS